MLPSTEATWWTILSPSSTFKCHPRLIIESAFLLPFWNIGIPATISRTIRRWWWWWPWSTVSLRTFWSRYRLSVSGAFTPRWWGWRNWARQWAPSALGWRGNTSSSRSMIFHVGFIAAHTVSSSATFFTLLFLFFLILFALLFPFLCSSLFLGIRARAFGWGRPGSFLLCILCSCDGIMVSYGNVFSRSRIMLTLSLRRAFKNKFAAMCNHYCVKWMVSIVDRLILDCLYDLVTADYSTEDDMFTIQMRCRTSRDKKLRRLGVWAAVCHT